MAEVKATNLVKVYTVLLLYKRPMHGYELIKELENCMIKKISASHVYPFLKILQKNKLIKLKAAGTREKKQYQLTREGQKFAQQMINRFADVVEKSIAPKIIVCAHCGCKLIEGWYKEKIGGKPLTFCCSRCAVAFKV